MLTMAVLCEEDQTLQERVIGVSLPPLQKLLLSALSIRGRPNFGFGFGFGAECG